MENERKSRMTMMLLPERGEPAVDRIILVSRCVFSRLALASMLNGREVHVVSSSESAPFDCGQFHTSGVVLHLKGGLSCIMRELCGLVTLMTQQPSGCPVVLLTEMSRTCALALLTLADMPEARLGHIRVVSDRLPAGRLCGLLHGALRSDCVFYRLLPAARPLSPAELRGLRALLYGVTVHRQARLYGLCAKSLYCHLYSALRRLKVDGRHALLCGVFSRHGRRATG